MNFQLWKFQAFWLVNFMSGNEERSGASCWKGLRNIKLFFLGFSFCVRVGGEHQWLRTVETCFLFFASPWLAVFYMIIQGPLSFHLMVPSSLKTSGSSLVSCQQAEDEQVDGGPGGVTWPGARREGPHFTLTPIHPIGQNPPQDHTCHQQVQLPVQGKREMPSSL